MPPTLSRLSAELGGRADDGWRRLLAPDASIAQYEEQLARAYGFESAFEAALAYAPQRVDMAELRPRAGYLVEDLLAIGMRPSRIAQLPQCSIDLFTSADEALGWIFVVEDSARQHGAVLRQVDARLPVAANANRYLRASVATFDERQRLLAAALQRADGERVIEAARVAVERVWAWYRSGQARAA